MLDAPNDLAIGTVAVSGSSPVTVPFPFLRVLVALAALLVCHPAEAARKQTRELSDAKLAEFRADQLAVGRDDVIRCDRTATQNNYSQALIANAAL